jgi:septal ring factor EnvC (AmiA/AmiB activator)
MKFYSEITKQLYDSEEQLKNGERSVAEEKAKKEALKREQENRKKEIIDLFINRDEINKQIKELAEKYCKDYGVLEFDEPNIKSFDLFTDLSRLVFNNFLS